MARSFNGSNDKITLPAAVAVPTGISISIWIYPTSASSGYGGIILRRNAGGQGVWSIFLKSTSKLAYYFANNGVAIDPGTATLSNNSWNHLAVTYDNSVGLKTFVNGASDGTAAVGGNLSNDASQNPLVGFDSSNTGFPGRLADACLWNITLTSGEISALSQGARPFNIRPSGIIGYWPIDGLQSPEPDLSGNANNGTLTGTSSAAGPPIMLFTPRWPAFTFIPAAVTTVFRKTLSSIGTRTGSRQQIVS